MKVSIRQLGALIRETIGEIESLPRAECRACGGTGEVAGEHCAACGGGGEELSYGAGERPGIGRGPLPWRR